MTPDFRDYRGTKWLAHYGVRGMRKGVRRYQNEDGSLTPEGYSHYGYGESDGTTSAGIEQHKVSGNNTSVSQNKPSSVSVKNDEEEKEETIKDRVESNNQKIAEAKENYIDRTEVDENETEQEKAQREFAKQVSDVVRARDELNAEKEAKRKKELEEKRRLNRSRVKKVVSDRNQTGKTNTYYVSR